MGFKYAMEWILCGAWIFEYLGIWVGFIFWKNLFL